METNENNVQIDKTARAGMIHFILLNSYLVYLYTIIAGVILDIIFPSQAFEAEIFQKVGVVIIIAGSILIYWAQSTSRKSHREAICGKDRDFHCGPYKYTRIPTHIGLTLATLGLGFLFQSVFIVLLVVVAFIISKIIFLPKQEQMLEQKYGDVYAHYKSKIKI